MNEKYQFIFIAPQNFLETRFVDLRNDDRVIYLEGSGKNIKNSALKFLKKIHLSTRINKYVDLPFKSIWGCNLEKISWEKDVTYYLIVDQSALWPIKPSYISKLKDKYNIKLVMLLCDFLDSDYAKIARFYMDQLEFNYIFSFDPNDCKKYGFELLTEHFSVLPIEIKSEPMYDLYFIGNNKNRLPILHEIYTDMLSNGLSGVFRISEVPKSSQTINSIIYNEKIKFEDMLAESVKANCILELLSSGQSGTTLRYNVAVCYNKKLLTNNKDILNLPFYNPQYMHLIDKPEDIDWNWVKERISIDYHYDGRFSPKRIIDRIIELEIEKGMPTFGEVEPN